MKTLILPSCNQVGMRQKLVLILKSSHRDVFLMKNKYFFVYIQLKLFKKK